MRKRTRTAIYEAYRNYEAVHGRGSVFSDTWHAALYAAGLWVCAFTLAYLTGRM